MNREEFVEVMKIKTKIKIQRQDALRAFGFDEDVVPDRDHKPQPLAPPRIISERMLHMDRITAKLRTDIPGFLKKYFNFPDDEYPEQNGTVPHVVTLLEEMFEGGSIVAEFATDHVKSVGSSEFFPIISLAENPDESHIICGANFADSKRRIQVVQRHLEGNRQLIEDFPWLRKPAKIKGGGSGGMAWSRVELTVAGRSTNRPDPSIYAAAIGSNDIRGRRAKLIMDDTEGEEHRHLPSKRKALYDFVKLEGQRCFEDRHESSRPLQIALGTPFDVDSIYFKLEREGWRVLKVPAYTVPWEKIQMSSYMKGTNTQTPWRERAALLPDRYFTWPRKRFKITEQDPNFGRKMTRKQFSIAYVLDPAYGDPTRLSLEQMERLVRNTEFPNEGDWMTFVTLDPAAGVGADYAGIAVVKLRWPRAQKLPEVQLLEAHAFEQGLIEQVNFTADLALQYGCPVMYESNAQQGGTYANAFRHHRGEVKLVPVYTSHVAKFDNEMGLTVIRTLIKSEKLKAPASMVDSEGVQQMLREVRDLGTDQHDHICMSTWLPVNWLYQQVRLLNGQMTDVPVMTRRFGAGVDGFFKPHVGPRSWRTWRQR